MNDALTLSEYQQRLVTQKYELEQPIQGFLARYLFTNKVIAAPLAILHNDEIVYVDCREIESLVEKERVTITKTYRNIDYSGFRHSQQEINISALKVTNDVQLRLRPLLFFLLKSNQYSQLTPLLKDRQKLNDLFFKDNWTPYEAACIWFGIAPGKETNFQNYFVEILNKPTLQPEKKPGKAVIYCQETQITIVHPEWQEKNQTITYDEHPQLDKIEDIVKTALSRTKIYLTHDEKKPLEMQ
ncbi:MAG: hypothetical protein GY821_01770 [Gammaproteobacteria bacterium]|nr:hypothetical protein [Gammaproteobacteria bacterium]